MTRPSSDAHDPKAAADNRLVVAISSRALFDLGNSHELFERDGLDAYRAFQIEHENDILPPGVAFPLVQKLLGLNKLAGKLPPVEVILLSRNSGDTGLRIFNAIQHYGLEISR
ncbi:5'-nucleotidase, partial [Dyella sp.]|uniref:5'-nucleotidase n=1 Tax=Dyella sp. TaxID=1869338 RepID=UPI002ED347B7